MKKLLFVVAIAAISVSVNAQKKKSSNGLQFGLQAGINVANVHFKGDGESETSGSLVGLNAGGHVIIPVTSSFGVQGEVAFSQMGGTDKSNSSYKMILTYIPVTVLGKYTVPNTTFGIYLGPQLGILTTAKAKVGSESADIKDSFESIDFAGVFGIEYTFSSSIPVGVAARYQMGFSNILKDSGSETAKNNGFTAVVYYRFGGKK